MIENIHTGYVLEWKAGARPPVHPEPMIGTQSFTSLETAKTFYKRLAPDSEFVSLMRVTTTQETLSSDCLF